MKNKSKGLNVVEAAQILAEKGITKGKNIEQQTRWWIRKYQEEYIKNLKYYERFEDKEARAAYGASHYGIRATLKSKREGYVIKEYDLNEFIKRKLEEKHEIDEYWYSIDDVEGELESEKERKGKSSELEFSEYDEGFHDGFRRAMQFLERKKKEKQKVSEEEIKTTLHFPKSRNWYLDENDIVLDDFHIEKDKNITVDSNEIKRTLTLTVSYKNIPGLVVTFQIKNNYHLSFYVLLDVETQYLLSLHNKRYYKDLFEGNRRGELDGKVITNRKTMLEILSKRLSGIDNENKMEVLLFIEQIMSKLDEKE